MLGSWFPGQPHSPGLAPGFLVGPLAPGQPLIGYWAAVRLIKPWSDPVSYIPGLTPVDLFVSLSTRYFVGT